jgi:dihydroorotate dehydrogenase electron transfer subunit
MSSPLHAHYYADTATQQRVTVVENVRIAQDTYRLRFACPQMARRIVPGQFLMLRLADCSDPLIGRPLAVYDVVADATGSPSLLDVVYLVKGKLTSRLEQVAPDQGLDVWGPLGNGFSNPPCDHLVMVAGGIGQTPFLTLAKEYLGLQAFGEPPRQTAPAGGVTFCYGARTANLLAGVDDFERIGARVELATEDGSRGHAGYVTDILQRLLAQKSQGVRVACCGPEAMMEAAASITRQFDVPCQVSLETPMACGIGICFTCVAKVLDEQGRWDYKRTCVEGPVFDAATIVW